MEITRETVILEVPYFQQKTDDTCAPACLLMALAFRFSHKPVSEAKLAKRCGCLKGLGCLVGDVFRAARRYRLNAEWLSNVRIELEVEAALKAGCPVLANIQLRSLPYYLPGCPKGEWHSALIVGLNDQFVYLHDPDARRGGAHCKVPRADFFSGWATCPYSAYRL